MTDRGTVRIVVVALTLIALVVVAGGIVLAFGDRELPPELIAIGSAAAGAVAALLARTSNVPSKPHSPPPTPLTPLVGWRPDTPDADG